MSWESDDSDDNKYIQIYDLISYEPEKFKNAHDTLVKELSKDMGGRPVGFGTYQIGGYKGATHWVAIGYKTEDLMTKTMELKERTKEWYILQESR